MNKIRKGDEIVVRTGKDKGRRGTVLQIFDDERVLVEGVNLAKKHIKPNPNIGEANCRIGGGVERERGARNESPTASDAANTRPGKFLPALHQLLSRRRLSGCLTLRGDSLIQPHAETAGEPPVVEQHWVPRLHEVEGVAEGLKNLFGTGKKDD